MLSFAYKRFDGRVPEPGELDDEDRALLEQVEAGFETVGELYNACRFRAALGEAMGLAREANGYLDRKAPWFQIKEDRAAAATSVYVILRVVDNLKTILAPILPHTPVLRTGHRSSTSTWAMRGSCSGRSTWSSMKRKRARTGR
jgi:methionyl-tRNA synthetase